MRKIILLAHISLDGYLSRAHGTLEGFDSGEENLEFVASLTNTADAAFFGRLSYELVNEGWPDAKNRPGATKNEIIFSNWYNSAEKIVVSKKMEGSQIKNTRIISNNLAEQVRNIKQEPGKDILLFGSASVAQVLIKHNLIDTYWIFVNPVLFGKGIPLFEVNDQITKLQLHETKLFANGEMALGYARRRE